MKPIRLTMEGFLSFPGKMEVDFTNPSKGGNFFLIHGPTGSGKTAILDAICFALYGDSSGGSREGKELRCQYCNPSDPTSVVFEMRLGPKSYRITRNPDYQRPARRGAGMTWEKHSARIEKGDGEGGWTTLATSLREVEEQIRQLVGFSAEQFRQVMIIPQGQFRELLTASTTDRRAILEQLFPIQTYRAFTDKAEARGRALRDELATLNTRRGERLARFHAATIEHLGQMIEQADADLAGLKQRETEARKEKETAAKALQTALDINRLFDALDAALAREKALVAREPEIAGRRNRLALARRASELQLLVERLREAEDQVAQRTSALNAARREHATTVERHGEALAALSREEERDKETRRIDGERFAMEQLRPQVGEIARLRNDSVRAGRDCADAEKDHGRLLQKVTGAESQKSGLEEEREQKLPLLEGMDGLAGEIRRLEQLRGHLVKLGDVAARRRKAQEMVARLEGEVKSTSEALSKATAHRAECEKKWREGIAVHLARTLVEGEPCSVCGSTHHPAKASAAVEPPSEEDLTASAEREKIAAQALEEARGELARESGTLSKFEGEHQTVAVLVEESEYRDVGALDSRLRDVSAQKKKAEEADAALKAIRENLRAIEEALVEDRRELATAQVVLEERRVQQAVADSGLKTALATLPKGITDSESLERRILLLVSQLDTARLALEQARKTAAERERQLAVANERESSAKKAHDDAMGALGNRRTSLAEGIKEKGFGSQKDFEASLADIPNIDSLEEDIRQFEKELHAAREQLAKAREEVKGKVRRETVELEESLHVAEEVLAAIQKEYGSMESRRREMAATSTEIMKMDEENREKTDRFETVRLVAGMARGTDSATNPKKLSLVDYILSAYLDEVLAMANLKLASLSGGRFALRRNEVESAGRAASGLDLLIDDAWSGEARRAATLSGGESFNAALSLALGLGDVVQNQSGGRRLETLFIDEGFGTLDEESLEAAIGSLLDLREGNKLVGIISHVVELRNAIDCRLEVMKREPPRGSQLKWHLP